MIDLTVLRRVASEAHDSEEKLQAYWKQMDRQTALALLDLLDRAVSIVKDIVECSEPMSDLEYRVAVKMVAREFLATLEQEKE